MSDNRFAELNGINPSSSSSSRSSCRVLVPGVAREFRAGVL